MMQALISIIVPVYNVEEYLVGCLDSLVQQTYGNIEVIIVNDGTTDTSEAIAKQYVLTDNRFRLINQENKGLSSARNTGLKQAIGDYVLYLDSDDALVENAIELLVNAVEEYQADVVQGNFYYDYPEYLLLNKQQKKDIEVYNKMEAMMALLEHKTVLNFAWGKLIKTDLAKKHIFPEGKYYEDTYWKYKIIHDSNKYVSLKQPIIYYIQRGSAISGSFSIRNLDQLEGELERLTFIKKHYSAKHKDQALKLINHKVKKHLSLVKNLDIVDQRKYTARLEAIIKHLDLNEKFPNDASGFAKNVNRLKEGIKIRLWGSDAWERINK